MKKIKQIAVMLLCLCILCGLPLSLAAEPVEDVEMNKAILVNATETTATIQVTFDEPVHIFDEKGFYIQSAPGVLSCDGNPENWISGSPTVEYVDPIQKGGKDYSANIKLTFDKCECGADVNQRHPNLWGADGTTLPENMVLRISEEYVDGTLGGDHDINIDVDTWDDPTGQGGQGGQSSPYITLDSAIVTAADEIGYTVDVTFSAPVTVPNYKRFIVMNQPIHGGDTATVCQNWQIQSMKYIIDGQESDQGPSAKLRLTYKYCPTHKDLWVENAEIGQYKVPNTGIFGGGAYLTINDHEDAHEKDSGILNPAVIHGENNTTVAATIKNPGQSNEYAIAAVRLQNYLPVIKHFTKDTLAGENGGLLKGHLSDGFVNYYKPVTNIIPEIVSAVVEDANDAQQVQMLVTFNTPVTMNIPSNYSWDVVMRFGNAGNSGTGATTNKRMSGYEYVDGKQGIDGKTYATQIRYTFAMPGAVPLAGKVGIVFDENAYAEEYDNGSVAPAILSDKAGQGLVSTVKLGQRDAAFMMATLAEDAQNIVRVFAEDDTHLIVEFDMAIENIDISAITAGSCTVTQAEKMSEITDNAGSYGSAKWKLTLNQARNENEKELIIPANALTTAYNGAVVAKELKGAIITEADLPPVVLSATLLDADDAEKVQMLVTFSKPVAMNVEAPSWTVAMRFVNGVNGGADATANKQMTAYEYVNGTTGADGKTYADKILFTFDKPAAVPLSGQVGITFDEDKFSEEYNNGSVAPAIVSDSLGQGLVSTFTNANGREVSFTLADLDEKAQDIVRVLAVTDTKLTVDFGMLVRSIDISKLTLDGCTVTAAEPVSVVSDAFGSYGSAQWMLTLDSAYSHDRNQLVIASGALTTPYNDTVVNKELKGTILTVDDIAPEVLSATLMSASDPDMVQMLVTFIKPVTMNLEAPSWDIMMRYGNAANGEGNKRMTGFEYVDGTVGADGKTYAAQILFTFDKADSLPLGGKVGIAFAEYNHPSDQKDESVSPAILSDDQGRGLVPTDIINGKDDARIAITFVQASLIEEAQDLIYVVAKNANQVTVDFNMLVQKINVNKITLGGCTVVGAEAVSPVKDNYGNHGSARWTLTLDHPHSAEDNELIIAAGALTTPYNGTVVNKELKGTMQRFQSFSVTDVFVDDETHMTIKLDREITDYTGIVASVRMFDAENKLVDELKLNLSKGEGNPLDYIAVPEKTGDIRSYSALWRTAQEKGYTLEVVVTYSGVDPVDVGLLTIEKYAFNPDAFTVVGVTQNTANTLLVKFSANVALQDIDKAWVCLRMINPKTGGVVAVKDATGKHMQWGASSVAHYEKDGQVVKDTLLVTFPATTDISLLLNRVNMDPQYRDYPIVLCMEEDNKMDAENKGNHLMYNIRRDDDGKAIKQLDVTEYKVSGSALNDAILVAIDGVKQPSLGLTADKIEVLDQTRLVITFSEPIVLDKPFLSIRPMNDKNQTKTKENTNIELFWTGEVSYYNDDHTKVLFVLHDVDRQKSNAVVAPIDGLHNIFAAGYEDDEYKLKFAFLDANAAHQRVMDGVIRGITGESGNLFIADCLNGLNDAVCLDIDTKTIPQGNLTITDVSIISDLEAVVSFSAPIEIVDRPYIGIRVLDSKNRMLWRTEDGELVLISKDANGNPTTPLQGQTTWTWYNEEHTQILIKITAGIDGMNNFVDMMNFDWSSLGEGVRVTVGVEEKYDPAILNNGRVDNIYMASDPRIGLLGNKFDGAYDGSYVEPTMNFDYKNVTMSASIINDMQVRIKFSHDVQLKGKTWFTLRYIDPETGVSAIWGDGTLNRTLIQFNGTWEWENNSKRSIIWTMKGNNIFGACNITDLVNQQGALSLFKGYPLVMTVQESDSEEFKVSPKNGRIENFVALDGKNRLAATALDANLDFAYAPLNTSVLKDKKDVELLEVNVIDDQTIELVFSEDIVFSDDEKIPTFTLRYINPTGESEVLVNGKVANFKGVVTPKEGDGKVLVYKLKSSNAKSITDILNYNGNLKWNKGARVCMVVENTNEGLPTYTKRMWGILSADKTRTLATEYMKNATITMDINVKYDLPAPEQTTDNGQVTTEYYSNYTPLVIGSAGMVVAGAAVMGTTLFVTRKKEEK